MGYFICAGLAGIRFLLVFSIISISYAESIEVKKFVNAQQEQRYRNLISEIRCPVCQGQSIDGSNSGLAKDLREQVRSMIIKTNTDDEIRQFMSARYGDFVVFKPPLNRNTYLLWYAPFVFLALGLLFFFSSLLSRKNTVETQTIDASKAKELLK